MIITIDGLSVNGKTTLAKMISKELGFKNFNTGAIYRCIALEIIDKNLDVDDTHNLISEISKLKIDFDEDRVLLNGQEVNKEIRTEKISLCSNKWAIIPELKEIVRNYQKKFIKENDAVIEGRDIATRIAPDADVKFYLYSDFETRVFRKWKQDMNIDINELRTSLQTIDDIDINGGNFIKPTDAYEIDTTNMSIEEVYNIMMNEINNAISKKEISKIKQL